MCYFIFWKFQIVVMLKNIDSIREILQKFKPFNFFVTGA